MSAVQSLTAPVADLVERLTTEGLIGMSAVAKLAGSYRDGKPTHPSTASRWATHGVRLAGGRVVKLEAIKFGNRLVTSRAAFFRFLAAQQGHAAPTAAPEVRSAAARRKAAEAATDELEKMGV